MIHVVHQRRSAFFGSVKCSGEMLTVVSGFQFVGIFNFNRFKSFHDALHVELYESVFFIVVFDVL